MTVGFLQFLFRRHRAATALLAVACAILIWFAAGFIRDAVYFSDPAHQRQDLAGWMTPRFVGKSWDLPPEVIIAIMELEPDHRRPTLREVTDHLGITLDDLQARVEQARADMDARHDPDHGGAP
jgi:hypothetical protein